MNVRILLASSLFVSACAGHAAHTASPASVEPLAIVDGLHGEPQGTCGAFESLGETAPKLALAGRLRLELPSDMVPAARPHDVMAAPTGDDTETRFISDRGSSRLVVLVQDTFASPGSDLAATVAQLEAMRVQHGTVARLRLPSGLESAIVEPTSVGGPPGGVLIDGAWVVTADGTVADVEVYVTPDLAPTPEPCRRVARTLLSSIAAGDARLDRTAGERTLLPGVTIHVPADHAIGHAIGPDFYLVHVIPIAPLGTQGATLGIYFGAHPNYEPHGDARPTTLFGRSASWSSSTIEGHLHRDAVVELPGLGYSHVFVQGDPAQVDALTTVAETLQYAQPESAPVAPAPEAPPAPSAAAPASH